ncbi:hypothetical protein J3U99_22535 [Brucella pituitosa]|uniref:hypothetical protein n=1 Tax=Brucella pituitosa TaxID=571256 RepID=UPI0020045A52|nr:hypothetical protein [Brucella pituitosa]MCK4207539.1 hypothetical protein [Brucella pituitosa]
MSMDDMTPLPGHPDFNSAAANRHDLDAGKYWQQVEDLDMSDEQRRELLETLWSIMRSFVELGFSADICAQLLQGFDSDSDGDDTSVE